MDNKIFSLTKVFLKNSFKMNSKTNKLNKKTGSLGNILVYIFAFCYLAGIVAFFSFSQISVLKVMGQEKVFLTVLFLGITLLMLIQSILSGLNILYFSKDMEYVLPLPVTPKQIIASKMNVVIITEYITEFIIGLAPLVIYGILNGAEAAYYVFALIALLVLPILPILFGTLIVMVIMSFSKFSKNKDKLQLITTIILIAIIIGMQFMISGNGDASDEDIANKLVTMSSRINSVADKTIIIPPVINALTNNDMMAAIISIAKVLLITFASYIVFIEIGKRIYLRGATSGTSGSTKKNNSAENRFDKLNIGISYVKKEFIMLFKNPIFFMQCVLPACIMPIILIVMLVVQFSNPESGNEISNLINGEVSGTVVICVVVALIQFMSMVTMLGVTAISRDGTSANFMKYIPVPLYNQFLYKIVPAFVMNFITFIIAITAVLIITGTKFLGLIIPIFIINMLINAIVNYFSEIVDLKHPKLEWNSEYEVVKQNFNMMYPLMLIFIIIIILAVLGFLMNSVSVLISSIIMIAIFGMAVFMIDLYARKNIKNLFKKIV